MIPKQDRLRPRTVEDLERMYNFKATKKETQEAKRIANEAKANATGAAMTQEDIFNRLTNNGQAQGFIMQDGQLYINADYITTGVINADLIKKGSLASADGKSVIFNLLNNTLKIARPNFTLSEDGSAVAKNINTESTDLTGLYSTSIEDGEMRITSPRYYVGEQKYRIDLFRFFISPDEEYSMYITVHTDENLVWQLDGFGIDPVEQLELEQV